MICKNTEDSNIRVQAVSDQMWGGGGGDIMTICIQHVL